jgi:nitroreductase
MMQHAGAGPVSGLAPATRQLMTGLLTVAMLAPSPRGRQPWRYQVHLGSQTIDLYADVERARRYGDPSGRAVHIACGAALLNLRLAAAVAGRQAVARLLPESARPRLLATFRLSGPHRVRPDQEELYAAIFRPAIGGHRHGPPYPAAVLAELTEAALLEGAALTFAEQEERGYLALTLRDYSELSRPGTADQSDALHLDVFSARTDGRAGWLRGGQAMQRVLLTAAARGIATSVPRHTWQDGPLSGLLGAPDGEGSADDEDRPVGEMDDLVRGAAQDEPGQIAAAP